MADTSIVTPGVEGVVFDLDGVLLDSRANMEASWEAVPRHLRKGVSYAQFRNNLGLPFTDAMTNLGLGPSAREIEAIFRKASLSGHHLSVPFPGATETLTLFREMGILIVLFTSKDCERTNGIIRDLGWSFDSILCPNPVIAGKPSGEQLIRLLRGKGISGRYFVYFGDSHYDFRAALDAGIPYRHCSWGFGERPGALRSKDQVDSFGDVVQTILRQRKLA